ncbi:MAG: DNA methyltransferase [Verrucomicrobia bacterium]|nr:DNA methyltransferase [Verrucomicrobiota bacterium]
MEITPTTSRAERSPLGSGSCSVSLPVPYYDAGGITIYHGDSRQIMPMLGRFDLLMADPPYGIGADKAMHKASGNVVGHGHRRVAKRTYEESDWDAKPLEAWVMEMARSLCQKQIIFGGNYYDLPPCKGPLVWDKEVNGNFADGEMAWNNLGIPLRIKRHLWNGMARKGAEPRHHPTQKPLEVIQWAIQLAGDVETILDPWAGSGTTGHAAKNLGKRCVMIEREERYCEIAAMRLAQDVLQFSPLNNSDQKHFCAVRQERYGPQICGFRTDRRVRECCF